MFKRIFFFLILVFSFSCTNKKYIFGEWVLEKINIEKATQHFSGEQKEFAKHMLKQSEKSVKGKLTLTFKEPNLYSIETPLLDNSYKKEKGTFKLKKRNKLLETNTSESGKEIHKISINKKKKRLVIEMMQSGFGIMEMTFRKK